MSIEAMKQAYQVPLVEQLESIPADARLVIDDADGMGTRYIPVGRMCREAAAALRTAIEQEECDWSLLEATQESLREHMAEIARLKAAQPAPVQEPVAYSVGRTLHWHEGRGVSDAQLYTTPPAQPADWVGLTPEDEEVINRKVNQLGGGWRNMVREADAMLREKNGA